MLHVLKRIYGLLEGIYQLLSQLALTNELLHRQNELLGQLLQQAPPAKNMSLQERLLDNTDLKHILKIADTKFFQAKKLFKTYRLDNKDYYLLDEVLDTIQEHKQS